EVIMGTMAHTFLFEGGGVSALGGVHPHTIPNQPDGTVKISDIESAIRGNDIHFPSSRLIILENTHNRCGGVPITASYTAQVAQIAHINGMRLHMDGARIFNASAALMVSAKALVDSVDSVTFCLSKGLCAPVGSVLCGSEEFIFTAKRIRKQLGGGMRQAGIIAAAGIVALETMIDRLGEDHDRAKRLSVELSKIDALRIDVNSPYTNMLFLSLDHEMGRTAREIAIKMKEQGILIGVVGEYQFRLVMHFGIDDLGIARTVETFRRVFST
ncbi:MAG: beta-eliminating lyase-related protein, partial [Anaerolineaceae bacterium]|nr:beta-eliminating lyase-related protein [Anaerolineaceae bacterium]